MERLTKKGGATPTMNFATGEVYTKIYNRLAKYEDEEESGIIIRIPCKVGDTLYTNWRWQGDYMRKKNAPYPVKVVFIGLNSSEEMGFGLLNVTNEVGRMWQVEFSSIGKTVFLTREEAERAAEKQK